MIKRDIKKLIGILIVLLVVAIDTCNGENDLTTPDHNCKAKFSLGEEVEWNDDRQEIEIAAPADQRWVARVADDWVWFDYDDYNSSTSGQGNGLVTLYMASNGNATPRTTTVEVEFESTTTVVLTLTQYPFVQADEPLDLDYTKITWAELPQVDTSDGRLYITHMTTANGKVMRNYSMCYDPAMMVSLWVAYPLHECYTSKAADRTDAWGYDPLVPAENQSNMSRSLGNGYDRGHQIASADRLASSHMNAQTFYYTNMTAQVGVGLNQSIWNNLENHIRSEYICSDTLYVVTGCVMTTEEDSQVQWVDNRNGGKVAVPKAYFKVLLRTKSGDTGQVVDSSNAMTIGFWYENRKYNYSTPRVDDVKSVGEIEQLTGLTFFPQISDHIKARKELESWGF